MKKIPTLFKRNWDTTNNPGFGRGRLVSEEITEGTEWVTNGEGVATRKFDGTCCMVRDGKLYRRFEVKKAGRVPINFELIETDLVTGNQVGWIPVGDGPEDKWHREGLANWHGIIADAGMAIPDATYELVGPKINSNPEKFAMHTLIQHGTHTIEDAPRNYEGLKEWFCSRDIEGIVWWHPDGRMVKIKKRDFFGKR